MTVGTALLADNAATILVTRWAIALAMALVAAWFDARTRRIPNRLTFPMFFLGLGFAAYIGGQHGLAAGFSEIGDSLLSALILMIPYFLLFAFAGGGSGDAKLMAALGAWLGLHNGLILLAAVALCGGVLGLAFALFKGRFRAVISNLRTTAFGVGLLAFNGGRVKDAQSFLPGHSAMVKMPYGLAIFVGTACAAGWVLLWQ